jgi:hypothetical protein
LGGEARKARKFTGFPCIPPDNRAAQKPSSARLTQLKANRPQAAAATEARVAIAFVKGMTEPFCMTVTLCTTMSAQKWREDARSKLRAVVAVLQHDPDLARKNP